VIHEKIECYVFMEEELFIFWYILGERVMEGGGYV
jgi:hypothetical protein